MELWTHNCPWTNILTRPITQTPRALAVRFVTSYNLQTVNKMFPEVWRGSLGNAAQNLYEKELGVGRINSKSEQTPLQ